MPVLERDGKVYAQSGAILKLLGAELGYYPTDAEDVYQVDALGESLRDVYLGLMKFKDLSEEEKKEAFPEFASTTLTTNFSNWEKKIKSNSSQEHYHGDKVTLADIGLINFYANIVLRKDLKAAFDNLLEHFPALKHYWEVRYEELKDYFEGRPECPF